MEKNPPPNSENCPHCGEPFDPREFEVLECPSCGIEGSTKCCIPGGRHCICLDCEEGKND